MFSQTEGFTNLSDLWGPMAFHALCTGLGTWLFGKAARLKVAA
ncbi:hypothetical protein ACFLYD_08710 [Chloroflexota bacterium]